MREILEDVMLLQAEWTSVNTPQMERRGVLVREDGAAWLTDLLPRLARVVGAPIDDLKVQGKDAIGNKSEVPWIRVYSESRSPAATIGWYVVYLFDALGDAVYLSLNQRTTVWDGKGTPARDPAELVAQAAWARNLVAERAAMRPDLVAEIALNCRRSPLGAGYERGNALAFRYPLDDVPSDDVLAADVEFMVSMLGTVYRAAGAGAAPGDVPPEVLDALEEAERSAGKHSPRGQGKRLSAAERTAIERRAEQVATLHYEAAGWSVEDVSKKPVSYDLHLTRDEEVRCVEVKGTTSAGQQVILTRLEVERQRDLYPNNALTVVRHIHLDSTVKPPLATGGDLVEVHPWLIADEDLMVISYTYETGGLP